MGSQSDAICVWSIRSESVAEPARLLAHELLGVTEWQEVKRFQTCQDQELACLSRVAGRLAASAMVGQIVEPWEWDFERHRDGGRILRATDDYQFNVGIADTDRTLGIALSRAEMPGLDVESCSAPAKWFRLASRYLASDEVTVLTLLGEAQGRLMYSMLWTAKEALAKAMRLPLAEILGRPFVSSRELISPRHLLDRGLKHGVWSIHWRAHDGEWTALCTRENIDRVWIRRVHRLAAFEQPFSRTGGVWTPFTGGPGHQPCW